MFSSSTCQWHVKQLAWQELPPAGRKNRKYTSARKFYGQNKRFLDRVIIVLNLIPDSSSKALWSLIPPFWALSPFLWALIPVIFWSLSPEPWAHIPCYDPDTLSTSLVRIRWRYLSLKFDLKISHRWYVPSWYSNYHNVYSLIYPFLTYTIHVWGLTYPIYLKLVTILQKRIVI